MGFPFDIQGPGSSRNILLHFLHNKAIEDGNQTCSPPFLQGLVGRMTYLDLTSLSPPGSAVSTDLSPLTLGFWDFPPLRPYFPP